MKREFEAVENDFNSMKEKFEAAKARNKVIFSSQIAIKKISQASTSKNNPTNPMSEL